MNPTEKNLIACEEYKIRILDWKMGPYEAGVDVHIKPAYDPCLILCQIGTREYCVDPCYRYESACDTIEILLQEFNDVVSMKCKITCKDVVEDYDDVHFQCLTKWFVEGDKAEVVR